MYPNITLEIKNNVARIVYYASEDNRKVMTTMEENLESSIVNLANKLNVIKKGSDLTLEELLELARESDETFIQELPDIDLDDMEIGLESAVKKILESKPDQNPYSSTEMNDEVRSEIEANMNADTFASALDYLYMTMIAKMLLAGSELGIGLFRLDDDSKNTRLQERMAMELERMGVEMIVV